MSRIVHERSRDYMSTIRYTRNQARAEFLSRNGNNYALFWALRAPGVSSQLFPLCSQSRYTYAREAIGVNTLAVQYNCNYTLNIRLIKRKELE